MLSRDHLIGAVRQQSAAVAVGRNMTEELYARDKVVDDLAPHCGVRVTTSTSTPCGESLSRVSAIPCCGTFQNLTFLVGRLGANSQTHRESMNVTSER